jgi:hypothetical protein
MSVFFCSLRLASLAAWSQRPQVILSTGYRYVVADVPYVDTRIIEKGTYENKEFYISSLDRNGGGIWPSSGCTPIRQ